MFLDREVYGKVKKGKIILQKQHLQVQTYAIRLKTRKPQPNK